MVCVFTRLNQLRKQRVGKLTVRTDLLIVGSLVPFDIEKQGGSGVPDDPLDVLDLHVEDDLTVDAGDEVARLDPGVGRGTV